MRDDRICIKRTIGIYLLAIANIVLLVHLFVPHHHHVGINQFICDAMLVEGGATRPDASIMIGSADPCCEGCTSDGVMDTSCRLGSIYRLLDREDHEHDVLEASLSYHRTSDIVFMALMLPTSALCALPSFDHSISWETNPPFLHSEYIVSSLGLRAPPCA